MSVLCVSNGLLEATGLLVQALEGVLSFAVIQRGLLTVASNAGALSEAGHVVLVGDVADLLTHVAAIKGNRTCSLESALITAACKDGSAAANVMKPVWDAGQVADIVLTFLLAVARKNLVVVHDVASMVVALDLVKLRRDGDSGNRGRHRDGASAVGHVGEDAIMLLKGDGREGLSRNMQEENEEDDKESEGLVVGATLSVLKAGTRGICASVQGLGEGSTDGKTETKGKTHRHDHPSAMVCLKGWM